MTIVGTAEVMILANDADFDSSLRAGAAPGLAGLTSDVEKSGAEMGDALGVASLGAGEKVSDNLANAYQDAAGRWHDSTGKFISEADAMALGVGEVGDKAGKDIEEGLGGGLDRTASKATSSGGTIKKALSGLGVPESLLGGWGAAAVAIGATAAVTVDLGSKMNTTETMIATASGTSVKAADAIGNAMLATAGKSEFSGLEQAKAYAQVAGQLKSTEGQTLSTGQAMQVMAAAGDLATAKQIDLADATSTVVGTMQAFQLSTKDAANVSDVLFNASNATGQSVEAVGQSLDKVKSKLGATAPPLSQLAGLLVDMTDHGETGRAAMTALSTTFTAFLKPATDTVTANQQLKVATDNLDPSLQKLAAQYKTGSMTAAQVTAATKGLTTEQASQWSAFTKATAAVTAATTAQQKMGISVVDTSGKMKPMGQIIGELHDQIAGMTTIQAQAQLSSDGLSNASSKLVETIQAGPAAYDKATASVGKMGSAHAAAQEQSKNLGTQVKVLKAEAEDWGTTIGQKLLPVLGKLLGGVVSLATPLVGFVTWMTKGSAPALAIAAAIGAVLVPALFLMGAAATKNFAIMIAGWVRSGAEAVAGAAKNVIAFASMIPELATVAAAWVAEGVAAAAAWIATMGPIALVVAAIALVAMGVYEVINHWGAIEGFFRKVWDTVKHDVLVAFDAILGFFKTWGVDLLMAFLPVVGIPLFLALHWHKVEADAEAIWGDIVSFFSGIPDEILNALSSLGGDLLHWIEAALDTLKSWTETALDLYLHYWIELPVRIIQAVEPFAAQAVSWIVSAFVALGQAVVNGIATVVGFFTGLPGKVLSALGDAGTWLEHAGEDIIQGLINGLTNAEHLVLNKISDIGHDISGAFKSVLSIFSPSKVFEGHGKNIMEGLTLGIDTNANLPVSAIRRVGNDLATGNALGASLSAGGGGTAGAAPASGQTIIVRVEANAVNINGLDPASASAASSAVNDGFTTLARELAAGVSPTKIGANA